MIDRVRQSVKSKHKKAPITSIMTLISIVVLGAVRKKYTHPTITIMASSLISQNSHLNLPSGGYIQSR